MRKLGLWFGAMAGAATMLAAGVASAQMQTPGAVPPQYPGQPGASNTTVVEQGSAASDLKESEKEDSGIGLGLIWVDANAGASYVDLKSFSESQLAVVDSSKSGLVYGFGAGLRLFILTAGLRVRRHEGMGLWQINAEVGLHPRIGFVEPYFAVRGGYDTVGTFNQSVSTATGSNANLDVQVHGWNVGGAFGLDFYLGSLVSIGGELAGDVLFLKRPVSDPAALNSLTPDQQNAIKSNPNYQTLTGAEGSSVGFAGALTAHLALHFL